MRLITVTVKKRLLNLQDQKQGCRTSHRFHCRTRQSNFEIFWYPCFRSGKVSTSNNLIPNSFVCPSVPQIVGHLFAALQILQRQFVKSLVACVVVSRLCTMYAIAVLLIWLILRATWLSIWVSSIALTSYAGDSKSPRPKRGVPKLM